MSWVRTKAGVGACEAVVGRYAAIGATVASALYSSYEGCLCRHPTLQVTRGVHLARGTGGGGGSTPECVRDDDDLVGRAGHYERRIRAHGRAWAR